MKRIVKEIHTYADGTGRWRARVVFTHTLSESDRRSEYNLHRRWDTLRRRARQAIIDEITLREKRTAETDDQVRRRVSRSLGRLVVVEQGLDSMNTWHSVTFGEQ